MNIRAWLIARLARIFAFDFSTPAAIERAIKQDRNRGPSMPPKSILKTIQVDDELRNGVRIFHAKPIAGTTSPIRFLYLHGGAFMFDLQAMQWNLVARMLQRIGGEVLIPIFPLAPEAGWQQTMAVVKQVYLEMLNDTSPKHIVVFGDSSGGCLSLLLAQSLREENKPLPAAQILISPCLDLSFSGADQPALELVDPLFRIEHLRSLGKMWAKDVPTDDARVSPLFGNLTELPPTIVFSGSWEIFDSDARRLAAANPTVHYRCFEHMIHVWPVGILREAHQTLNEAAAFVDRHIET